MYYGEVSRVLVENTHSMKTGETGLVISVRQHLALELQALPCFVTQARTNSMTKRELSRWHAPSATQGSALPSLVSPRAQASVKQATHKNHGSK